MLEHTDFDTFDHRAHIQTTLELARQAGARGDGPFGSILVRDDAVVMRASNRVVTAADIRRHPELHLAYRACQQFGAHDRADMVMYTSTEPCPMCAGGMLQARFGAVVFSVGADELAQFHGRRPALRSAAVLAEVTPVVGPVLNDEGRRVHREFGA